MSARKNLKNGKGLGPLVTWGRRLGGGAPTVSVISAHAIVLVGSPTHSYTAVYCICNKDWSTGPGKALDTIGAPPPRRLPHVTNGSRLFPFFTFFLTLVFRVYQAHVKTGKAWERGYLHTVLLVLYGAALHHMDHVTICNTIWSTVSCHLWIMWLVRETQYYITCESCDLLQKIWSTVITSHVDHVTCCSMI